MDFNTFSAIKLWALNTVGQFLRMVNVLAYMAVHLISFSVGREQIF